MQGPGEHRCLLSVCGLEAELLLIQNDIDIVSNHKSQQLETRPRWAGVVEWMVPVFLERTSAEAGKIRLLKQDPGV